MMVGPKTRFLQIFENFGNFLGIFKCTRFAPRGRSDTIVLLLISFSFHVLSFPLKFPPFSLQVRPINFADCNSERKDLP